MLKMKLIKRETEGELLLDGRLDNASAADAEKILVDVAERFDSVILNMKNLESITSAGLRVLRNAIIAMRKKGGKIMAANVNPMVMDVLKITGFLGFLKVA